MVKKGVAQVSKWGLFCEPCVKRGKKKQKMSEQFFSTVISPHFLLKKWPFLGVLAMCILTLLEVSIVVVIVFVVGIVIVVVL